MSGRIGAALLVVGCVLLGGCASEAEEPLLGRSSTPRLTVGEASEDLEGLLLSEGDVQGVPGFGQAAASDLDDLELYENPDPRGPCGVEVDQPPTPDGGRAFTTEDATLLQFVWADAGTIEGHLDAFEDDLQPGCGSFASVTNVGTTQEVSEPVPIDTEGIGDRAIGWTATLTVSGQIAETGSVVVVVGEQATLVQEVGREVDGDQLAAVARMVAERAEG